MQRNSEIEWIASSEHIHWEELSALYEAVGMGKKSHADLATVFRHSRYVLFAMANGKLIGAGRALADGVDCAYLADIAIAPAWQRSGLGSGLVQRLLTAVGAHRKIILYAVPGKEAFYRQLGFRRMPTAMGIFADTGKALAAGYLC